MLTLTRKIGQKVLIGNRIEIVVREVRGRQVRLGINAPQELPVYREELYQQIADENIRAAQAASLAELHLPEPSKRPGSARPKSPQSD